MLAVKVREPVVVGSGFGLGDTRGSFGNYDVSKTLRLVNGPRVHGCGNRSLCTFIEAAL